MKPRKSANFLHRFRPGNRSHRRAGQWDAIGAILSLLLLPHRAMRPQNTEHVRERCFELLDKLHETLHQRGIDFRLAEAHRDVRNSLRRAGLETFYGPIVPDQTVDAVLKSSLTESPTYHTPDS